MFYIVEGMYGAQLVTFAAVHCETENVILSVFTIVILKIMMMVLLPCWRITYKKYRIYVGADGDDFIYADDLDLAEAEKIKQEIPLHINAYAYLKEVPENG